MKLRCLVVVTLLALIAAPTFAQLNVEPELNPRAALPKVPDAELQLTPQVTGRLNIKFTDAVHARITGAGVVSQDNAGAQGLAEFKRIVKRFDLTVSSAFPSRTENELAVIQARAAAYSGKEQPDLAGVMIITGPAGNMEAAARAINQLGVVEFIEFEPVMTTSQGMTGACCVGGTCIANQTVLQCTSFVGGIYLGDGSTCGVGTCLGGACCAGETCLGVQPEQQCVIINGGEWAGAGTGCAPTNPCVDLGDPTCGDAAAGPCDEVHAMTLTPFCMDEECCDAVCEIDPFCCDMEAPRDGGYWAFECLEVAAQVNECGGGIGAGKFTLACILANGDCFQFGGNGGMGCNQSACCNAICITDPVCCTTLWDANCATLANTYCIPTTGPTIPNFTMAQGYRTAAPWLDRHEVTGVNLGGAIPGPVGDAVSKQFDDHLLWNSYTGEGYDLQGLWDFGNTLINLGGGTENLTKGKGVKIGVVEHSAVLAHQDLAGKVILEPGFDISDVIIDGIPGSVLDGEHGTATLGIIGAIDHGQQGLGPDASMVGEVGCVGIAPEAELYFFPTLTIAGARTTDALMSAATIFGPGDVLNLSIVPEDCGTFVSDFTDWMTVRLLTDLGITVCISAGNEWCDLVESPQAGGDSGAIIVGACKPGFPFSRAGFSNHGADVDVSGWGEAVMTLGTGDAFQIGNDRTTSYTGGFSGTSAAAPMVAGIVACLQGIAKQLYGIPLPPEDLRELMSDDDENFSQDNNYPDDPPFGSPDGPGNPELRGDYSLAFPPNRIGPFTNLIGTAVTVLTTEFFDGNGLIDSVEVIRGNLLIGSLYSILANDASLLVVGSMQTPRNFAGTGLGGQPDPQSGITYLAGGQITDVLIRAHSNLPVTNSFEFTHIGAGLGSTFTFYEAWNWNTSKYEIVNFTFGTSSQFFVNNSGRFVNPDEGQIIMRVWTFGFNAGNVLGGDVNSASQYNVQHNLFMLEVFPTYGIANQPAGGVGGGGGGGIIH